MLPDEWRAKRRVKFRLETLGDIPDGTKVTIACGSIRNPSQELRNNIAVVNNSAAEFDDLRFEGKSGRGEYGQETMLKTLCTVNAIVNTNVIHIHDVRAKYEGGVGKSTGG